jgi:SHS2 domain-containing protein
MSHQYRLLEEIAVADAAFEATGDSPSEVFLAASQALIDIMADPATVGNTWRKSVERQASDVASLLFDWLSEMVFLKDAQAVVYSGVTVRVEQSEEAWRLQGTLMGEPIDPVRQDLRADVKAVTKHLYDVRRQDHQWIARVVLDI